MEPNGTDGAVGLARNKWLCNHNHLLRVWDGLSTQGIASHRIVSPARPAL